MRFDFTMDSKHVFFLSVRAGPNGRRRLLVPLEVLHLSLVLLCFFKRGKGAEIAPFACGVALLSRVQTIFAGF
jgi:hypothetical protein